MSVRQVQTPWLTDVFTTTDATPHNSAVAAFAPPANCMGKVQMDVMVRNTATNVGASTTVTQTFKNVAGVVTLDGTISALTPVIGNAALAAIVAAFLATGGTTITPVLTGILATNLEWLISVRYWVN